MLDFHKISIVIFGIILSFLLFDQGEKYNYQSFEYGELVRYCEEKGNYCEYANMNRDKELTETYGSPYWFLARRLRQQKAYVIIPVVILIVTLFVSFTLDSREVLFTAVILCPLFLHFLINYVLRIECCLTPFYLLYAIGLTYVFRHIRQLIY